MPGLCGVPLQGTASLLWPGADAAGPDTHAYARRASALDELLVCRYGHGFLLEGRGESDVKQHKTNQAVPSSTAHRDLFKYSFVLGGFFLCLLGNHGIHHGNLVFRMLIALVGCENQPLPGLLQIDGVALIARHIVITDVVLG